MSSVVISRIIAMTAVQRLKSKKERGNLYDVFTKWGKYIDNFYIKEEYGFLSFAYEKYLLFIKQRSDGTINIVMYEIIEERLSIQP